MTNCFHGQLLALRTLNFHFYQVQLYQACGKAAQLFPITLTEYVTLKKRECLDSATGEALAEAVRKYHLPNFSNWQPPAALARAFARLEKDLRTSLGK